MGFVLYSPCTGSEIQVFKTYNEKDTTTSREAKPLLILKTKNMCKHAKGRLVVLNDQVISVHRA